MLHGNSGRIELVNLQRVIVTGANGFVGSGVCKELTSQGVSVVAIVRNEKSNIEKIKDLSGLQIVYCDMSDFGRLYDLIDGTGYDALYHFAWDGSAGPLRGNDAVQLDNVRYTCELVKACKRLECKRFIFASSIMEYEISKLMETTATPGINTIYSSAKICADYFARAIASDLNIEYLRGVISNIYGPGETSPRLVNTSIRKMLSGEHCSFSSGVQLYDFIYIDDAAKAFVAIGDKGRSDGTYYIGSLNPRPLKDFLKELRDVIDPEIELGLGDIPFNGVSLSYDEFDINAVKNDTGFVPVFSFAEGIRNTVEWIKETDNL